MLVSWSVWFSWFSRSECVGEAGDLCFSLTSMLFSFLLPPSLSLKSIQIYLKNTYGVTTQHCLNIIPPFIIIFFLVTFCFAHFWNGQSMLTGMAFLKIKILVNEYGFYQEGLNWIDWVRERQFRTLSWKKKSCDEGKMEQQNKVWRR